MDRFLDCNFKSTLQIGWKLLGGSPPFLGFTAHSVDQTARLHPMRAVFFSNVNDGITY